MRHKDALESGVAGGKGAPSVKTPGIEASHLGDKPGALTGLSARQVGMVGAGAGQRLRRGSALSNFL